MTDAEAVLAANDAFYRAFESLDIDRMRAVWLNGASISCIHPGWGALVGWPAVMESWEQIFAGTLHMEFTGGAFDAREGDFIHVPAGAVHRESNRGSEPNLAVFSRAGTGAVTVNVEAPPKA